MFNKSSEWHVLERWCFLRFRDFCLHGLNSNHLIEITIVVIGKRNQHWLDRRREQHSPMSVYCICDYWVFNGVSDAAVFLVSKSPLTLIHSGYFLLASSSHQNYLDDTSCGQCNSPHSITGCHAKAFWTIFGLGWCLTFCVHPHYSFWSFSTNVTLAFSFHCVCLSMWLFVWST